MLVLHSSRTKTDVLNFSLLPRLGFDSNCLGLGLSIPCHKELEVSEVLFYFFRVM